MRLVWVGELGVAGWVGRKEEVRERKKKAQLQNTDKRCVCIYLGREVGMVCAGVGRWIDGSFHTLN